MLNVCPRCGLYRDDKLIDHTGPGVICAAICPECGFAQPFRQQPLFLIGGANGSGKSALCRRLTGTLDSHVLLDADILWLPEFDTPADGYHEFFATWLRLAVNIGQSGRPVAIFGAGFAVPENVEPCVARRYFSVVHYLALVCDDDVLAARLRQRPTWRATHGDDNMAAQQAFNRWLKAYVGPPRMTQLDTSALDEAATAQRLRTWLNGE